jgi:hypothetical protein
MIDANGATDSAAPRRREINVKTLALTLASTAALAVSVATAAFAAGRSESASALGFRSDVLADMLQQTGTPPAGVGQLPVTSTIAWELWVALAVIFAVFGTTTAALAYIRR